MNYRQYVGSEGKWDAIGAAQFCRLIELGLREHHYLLDVGCGALRAGRLFIVYLNRGRYWGIEPNEELVHAGVTHELGQTIVDAREPVFLTDDTFTLSKTGRLFNYVLLHSIWTHASKAQIAHCMTQIAMVLGPRGIAVATFRQGSKDSDAKGWTYPNCVLYRPETLAKMAKAAKLKAQFPSWSHPNRHQWMVLRK